MDTYELLRHHEVAVDFTNELWQQLIKNHQNGKITDAELTRKAKLENQAPGNE